MKGKNHLEAMSLRLKAYTDGRLSKRLPTSRAPSQNVMKTIVPDSLTLRTNLKDMIAVHQSLIDKIPDGIEKTMLLSFNKRLRALLRG